MINWLIMATGIVLLSYEPALKLLAKIRDWAKKPVLDFSEIRPERETVPPTEKPRDPTRLEAFQAAETLVAYFKSIGHASAADSANDTAQWLFTEPGDE
jgi:hypothetical protein